MLAVLGPALAGGLVDLVLKPLFDRHIDTSLSFPSGHTAATASLALVVICAMVGPGRLPWPVGLRWLIAVAATASVPIIAIALVGGGYHYATDTIGGLLVADRVRAVRRAGDRRRSRANRRATVQRTRQRGTTAHSRPMRRCQE